MEDIKQRLKDASDACIKTFDAWHAKPGDHSAREALQEAVHELRKVGARLEIELAVSDRKTQGNEPIPIPSHRAARRQGGDLPEMGDDEGNRQGGGNRGQGRDNRDRQGGGRPVQIRQREEAGSAPQQANDAPGQPDQGEAGERKSKPLSLRRTSGEAE